MRALSEGLHSIVAELQPAPDELQRQQQGLAIVRQVGGLAQHRRCLHVDAGSPSP